MYHSKKQIILSSILSLFLVSTLVITSTLMVNPNFSLDIRNYAKSQLEPEEEAFLKKHTRDSIKTSNTANPPANNSNSEPKERKQKDDEVKDDPSTSTVVAPPVVAPTPATIKTDEQIEEDFLRNNLQNKQTTSTPTTISPTSASPVVTPPPVSNTVVERIQKDDEVKDDPSTSTVVTPPPATIKTDEQIEEEYMERRQKTVAQSPVKTPTPTPNTAMEQFRCGERGGDWVNGQCQSPGSTPTKPIEEPTSFWQQLSSNFNNAVNNTGMVGMGTGGLGMDGNTTAIPQSVITSTDPDAVNNYLVGQAYAGAAGTAIAATVLATPAVVAAGQAIWALAGGSVASLPTAIAAYGGATLATLPVAAQATLAYGSSALILGGTAYATNECIKSNDPGSPACVGLVTGYQVDPVGFNQELSDSANTLTSGATSLISNVKTKLISSITPQPTYSTAYEFYNPADVASYRDYVAHYGAPPERINLVQSHKELYPFQTEIINGANPTGMNNTALSNSLQQLKEQNVSIHVLSPEQLELQFGEGIAGACTLGECKGIFGIGSKRTADLYVTDISGYASMYNTSQAEASLIAAQKIGHEGGHSLDWINLGLGSGNNALWASEFRQKAFNMVFYESIGETQAADAYRNFLNTVIDNTQVVVQ